MNEKKLPRFAKVTGAMAITGLLVFAGVVPMAQIANANPAPVPPNVSRTTTGAFSGTVPDGVCAVQVTALGGAGALALGNSGTNYTPNSNGAGARVVATFPVVPGQSYDGSVGGGGAQPPSGTTAGGAGGVNGGGDGGIVTAPAGNNYHNGGGGGGWTEVRLGGQTAIVAGGGGGTGAGHSTDTGFGGDAGLPTAAGVTAGSDGLGGKNAAPNQAGGGNSVGDSQPINGGQGGQTGGPGAGGTNPTQTSRNGYDGDGRTGGNGGLDNSPDSGGGGGGGWFGAGGGASTWGAGSGNNISNGISGAGGGGGASYVNPVGPAGGGPTDISSSLGPKLQRLGNGDNGSVELAWIMCDYDLEITKTASPTDAPVGSTVTWTIAITNRGPGPMTRGDTVTLTDDLAGEAPHTVTAISVSGGSNEIMDRGEVTTSVQPGDPMPSELNFTRPYAASGAAEQPAGGTRGLDVGETLTVSYTSVAPGPEGAVSTNTARVTDRSDPANNTASASVTSISAVPIADPDESEGPQGVPQSVSPLDNDHTGPSESPLDPDSLTLLDENGDPVDSVTIDGEGTYTIDRSDPADPKIVFTPEPQFTGEATPVDYRISNEAGESAESTYTPTVDPVTPHANPDVSSGPQGATQSVDPFANDEEGHALVPLDPDSLTLLDENGDPTDTVTIPGEGEYTIDRSDPENPKLVFTPEPGFTGTATPVDYRIADANGTEAESTYTPTVGAVANPDVTSGPQGVPQRIDPLENDGTDEVGVVPDSLTLLDEDGNPTDRVEIPGEGVYTIEDGMIVFTPEPDFIGTATPVRYQVEDTEGDTVESTYTPTLNPVTPNADADETSGPQGRPQSSAVLDNDEPGDEAVPLDPDSLTLLDENGDPTDTVTIDGEGTYTIDRSDPANPKIVFTPEPQFTGIATPVDYQIVDVNGTTARSDYTPTVDPVRPVAEPDETTGPQGRPQSTNPLANDAAGHADVPLDPGSLTLLDENGDPTDTVTIDGEGTYTIDRSDPENPRIVFTPEPQFTGTATPVDYQVADVNGTTAQSRYTPAVAPVRPTANTDATSGPQGQPQSTDPFENDAAGHSEVPLDRGSLTLLDEDGNPVDEVVIPDEGTYTVDRSDPDNPRIVFTPEPNFVGEAIPVDYRIADVNGTTADSTYTPTVTPVRPTANPDQTSGPQGKPQSSPVLGNDAPGDETSPLDPDSLVLLDENHDPTDSVTIPGEGTYTIDRSDPENPQIVFTPEPGFTGTATPVQYQINDVNGTPAESTYTPTVTPTTPRANPDDTSGPQGKPQSSPVLSNDTAGADDVPLDPDSLTLLGEDGEPTDAVTVPGEGRYTIDRSDPTNPRIVFTPEPDFTGTAKPVDYRVSDTNGTPAESQYTPTVNPVVPTAAPDRTSGPQGQPQSSPVLSNDAAGDTEVPLDPDSLTLLDENGDPADSVTVAGEGTYTVDRSDPANPRIVFTPEPQFTGTAKPVDYRVSDINGTAAESQYTPTITPVAPTASPDVSSGPQGAPQSVDPFVNDAAGDPSAPIDRGSLTLLDENGNPTDTVTVPGEGSYSVDRSDPANPRLVFTPEPGFTGTAKPVDYRITDTNGTPAESTYTPTVGAVANPDVTSGPQGVPQRVDPLANDGADGVTLDPDSLTLLDENGQPVDRIVVPGEGSYTIEDGQIVFTPEPDFVGTATPVRYQVKDTDGNPVESTYTPTLTPVTPVANPDETSGPQGQPQSTDPFANDRAGDDAVPIDRGSLTLLDENGQPTEFVTIAGEGTYTVDRSDPANPRIVFTPEPQFTGTATPVGYRIADVNGTTADSNYTPTVTPVVPEATDDVSRGHVIGEPVTVNVIGNDSGGLDPSAVRIVDPVSGDPVAELVVPGEGTWTVNPDGTITFTPELGFSGNPTPITYSASTAGGQTVTARVIITYLPQAADDESLNNRQGTAVTVPVLGNDQGALDPATVQIVDGDPGSNGLTKTVPGEGQWSVNPETGEITFTPEPGFTGNPSDIDYTVSDSEGNQTGASVHITYTPEEPVAPPQANNDESLNNPSGSRVTVPVLDNDTGNLDPATVGIIDPETGEPVKTLTVPGEGVWQVNPDGSITFTPEDGFTGNPTPIEYVVSDLDGNEVRARVTITYVDAPIAPEPPVTPEPPVSPKPGQPKKPGKPVKTLPVTGSDSPVSGALIAGVLLISGAAGVFLVRRKKR